MASKSRWLVGSSSNRRSEGHISACARFSRMRQPPEKLATASPICSCVKPRPCRSCSAREQARLPRAVRADQAYLVAGIERDVGAFEQRFSAAAERDLGEADHVSSIRKARIVRGTPGQSGPVSGTGLADREEGPVRKGRGGRKWRR